MAFPDHFSERSALYCAARPRYPTALFDFIASVSPGRERAWDCATGNGQAAAGLARHFARVDATDASVEQIANAAPIAHVSFAVEAAEAPSFGDSVFDCVCVAQALHWFDPEPFHRGVHHVLKPGGVFAAWGYVWMHLDPAFDQALEREVLRPLHAHWPEQNRKLWNGYRDLPFPYEVVLAPEFSIEVSWSLDQVIGYVGSWSATRALQKSRPAFLEEAHVALSDPWGEEEARTVTMPLQCRFGRHAA